ncbi:MAG: magnesium chelatase subunit H [Beijerinckiaceae bacterium]|nr:magnesium chelatase subunit H [Beijerinckiaceae bacterium]
MTRKPITAAEATPVRVVIVTLDDHLAGSVARAQTALRRELPGLSLEMHSAAHWGDNEAALARCNEAIGQADIVIATMLFMEDHLRAVVPALQARRDTCDAMVVCMSAGEAAKLTRMGRFTTHSSTGGLRGFLKKLRGRTEKSGVAGANQMKMLRRIPRLLKFIPGAAQDIRAYLLTLQYWLAGSDDNVANLVRFLINRYSAGPRAALKGALKVADPVEYPDVGVYHPRLARRLDDDMAALRKVSPGKAGTVGLIVMRSYLLAGNSAHYDGVIAALEARGLSVVPVFASGLDARPAIERFFFHNNAPAIDAMVSLTGFSLVGGPAYNDAKAAEEILARLDVPYLAAHPLEFQTIEQWSDSDRGLTPVEATIMVAIPELDGARAPMVFGGRSEKATDGARDMLSHDGRADMLAARVGKLVALRKKALAERKIAIVIFNFPPNAGAVGTAAFLSVFESVRNTLHAMKAAGYTVDAPETADDLREAILHGNAQILGANANVHARIPVDHHVANERHLDEIEAQWGPAPGRHQTDGSSIFVLGAQFGNVFVGIQPAFGYEGDPMRLLFEKGFAPTHAFSAFYNYLKDDFRAEAVLHFGTHGALEFMPGKQCGLGDTCWPDRLIGDLPNFYLYASNNPSEGAIAKRRAAATLISYLTPPIAHAGLYRGLLDLKGSIDQWRSEETGDRSCLASAIQSQAAALDLASAEPAWGNPEREIGALANRVLELEYTLIPHGLHVVGGAPSHEERIDMLVSLADSMHGIKASRADIEDVLAGAVKNSPLADLAGIDAMLQQDTETAGLLAALDGRFIRPAPGGDLLRTPAILPTGRNLHGFDPFRIPSTFAMEEGARHAAQILDRHMQDGNDLPQSVAMVLWGTDNLKTQGVPIAQALSLLGARPRFDGYGRLCGAELAPLSELGRPRIDVVATLSGIFRDLMPLQTKLLAEAAYLAASADEPVEMNFVRRNALAYMQAHDCDLETAALRVFSNADGAYGGNLNHAVESGAWDDEDELADMYARRKCFAYGRSGRAEKQPQLLESVMAGVDVAFQNLESVELGVTTLDQYFDNLGGVSRMVKRATGKNPAIYIGDQTRGAGVVRSLNEQVSLETRTRTLNPKWYEGMLKHGYEGVRQIEAQVTNTMGWSATTGQVDAWVYAKIADTFMLDPQMRARLADLNPASAAKVANRLIEASDRNYWSPDEATLEALRRAGEDIEDRLEGVTKEMAA